MDEEVRQELSKLRQQILKIAQNQDITIRGCLKKASACSQKTLKGYIYPENRPY